MSRYLRTGALAMATAILAGALGAAAVVAQDPVEIDWWHLDINDPGKSLRQTIADEYMAMHPNVKINVTVLENEALKSAARSWRCRPAARPDIFHSWGGGVLAEQVDAGMVQALDEQIADWVDAERGRPKRLAGRRRSNTACHIPSGWSGSSTTRTSSSRPASPSRPRPGMSSSRTSQALKDAGITPIAVAGQDKWPAMFYWAYLALRIGGQAAYEEAIGTGNWDGPAFVEAGNQLKRLIDLEPFQEGFLAATYDKGQAADDGQREGRHGADGPMGSGCSAGEQ